MEIRIDERLVDVFNEVTEKSERAFKGEKNLEKAINSHLAEYFSFILSENDGFLTEESEEKLMNFIVEDINKDDKVSPLDKLIVNLMIKATKKK
jgi:hypothetical protein|nr:MAG TPA: hypothetical protein [Caudoviricetes sp.]